MPSSDHHNRAVKGEMMIKIQLDRTARSPRHPSALICFMVSTFLLWEPPIVLAQRGGSPSIPIRAVVVELQPHGFVPQQIRQAPGAFVLVVYNRTGRNDISLELSNTAAGPRAPKLVETWTTKRQRSTTPVLALPPGQYVLTEAHNPGRTLTLLITP